VKRPECWARQSPGSSMSEGKNALSWMLVRQPDAVLNALAKQLPKERKELTLLEYRGRRCRCWFLRVLQASDGRIAPTQGIRSREQSSTAHKGLQVRGGSCTDPCKCGDPGAVEGGSLGDTTANRSLELCPGLLTSRRRVAAARWWSWEGPSLSRSAAW
jgi:hypothetical protein